MSCHVATNHEWFVRKGVLATYRNSLSDSSLWRSLLPNRSTRSLSEVFSYVNKALCEPSITSVLNLKVNLCSHLRIIKYFMNVN